MSIDVTITEKDFGWNRIKREVKKFENAVTYVGYFSNGVGGPDKNIAARALVQETGATIRVTPNMKWWWLFNFGVMLKKTQLIIPATHFMRKTFRKNKKSINDRIAIEYNNVLAGKRGAKQAITRVGAWYVGRIKAMIKTGKWPKLSPITIRRKKSTKRLVDTSEMWRAATHREEFKK